MSGDTREVLKLLQNPVRNPTVAGLGQKPAIQGARKADVEFFLRCMEFLELLRYPLHQSLHRMLSRLAKVPSCPDVTIEMLHLCQDSGFRTLLEIQPS